jgi:hypothetical protein
MLPAFFSRRLAIALTGAMTLPLPLTAQDVPLSLQTAAACASVPVAEPSNAPRIIGGRDTAPKALYGPRDSVVIDAGATREIEVGQRFFVRRAMRSVSGRAPRGQDTSGWLTVVAVTERTAIATIDFACGGIAAGDHFEPYAPPVLPGGIDRTDARGELDFTVLAPVMYGDKGRSMGGGGDFMIAGIGQNQGVAPGARFGIFRDVHRSKELPLTTVGEAVAVSVSADHALIRLTETRDAVVVGDLLVRRKPAPEMAPASATSASASSIPSHGQESTPATTSGAKTSDFVRDYAFEDVHFDFDQFTLRPEALVILDEAIAALQRDPLLHIQI